MSIESEKAYIERAKTDEKFRKRVKTAADQEARMFLVKKEGFDFIAEHISAVKTELSLSENRIDTGARGSSQAGEVTVGAIIVIVFLALCGLFVLPDSSIIDQNVETRQVSQNIDETVEAR